MVITQGISKFGLLFNYLKLYAKPLKLLLVLNFESKDFEFLSSMIRPHINSNVPIRNTTKILKANRAKHYTEGGVIFSTSQIIAMDLISELLNPALVDNVILFEAQKFQENSGIFFMEFLSKSSDFTYPREFMYVIEVDQSFVKNAQKLKEVSKGNYIFWPYFKKEIRDELHKDQNFTAESEVSLSLDSTSIEIQNKLIDIKEKIEKKMSTLMKIPKSEFKKLSEFEVFGVQRDIIQDYKRILFLLKSLSEYPMVDFYFFVMQTVDEVEEKWRRDFPFEFNVLNQLVDLSRDLVFFKAEGKLHVDFGHLPKIAGLKRVLENLPSKRDRKSVV